MIELTKNIYGSITIDSVKTMLADHDNYPASICRHGADNMDSISGYIADPKNKNAPKTIVQKKDPIIKQALKSITT